MPQSTLFPEEELWYKEQIGSKFTDLGLFLKWVEDKDGDKDWSLMARAITGVGEFGGA